MLSDIELQGVELVLSDSPDARTLANRETLLLVHELQDVRREIDDLRRSRDRHVVAAATRSRLVAEVIARRAAPDVTR